MKGKAIIPLAVGLGVGLLAVKLAVDAIQKAQGSTPSVQEVNVVVATTDIGPTMAVTADMLVVKRTPKSPLIPPNAYEKAEDVIGRVTSKTILAGTPVSPALLAPEGTLPGLQVKIEEGYRAVSVKIDEVTGVAYQLLPGAFVDVLVVMDVKDGRRKETISRVILQKVQVAAVGQHLGDPSDEGTNNKAKSVTLLVKSEDVPKLHLAQTKGKITLAMRSAEDELLVGAENAKESEILGTVPRETEPENPPAAANNAMPTGLAGMVASSLMQGAPPVRPPFTTTVINGPVASKDSGQVLRVTYRDSESMDVVAVQEGRTSGDDGSLRFGSGPSKGDEAAPRRYFADRDRTLRRLGASEEPKTAQPDRESETEELE